MKRNRHAWDELGVFGVPTFVVHTRTHARTHADMHTPTRPDAPTHSRTPAPTHPRTHSCTHTCTRRICLPTHMRVCTWTHVHGHALARIAQVEGDAAGPLFGSEHLAYIRYAVTTKGTDIFSGHSGIWHPHYAFLAHYHMPQNTDCDLGDVLESGNAKENASI